MADSKITALTALTAADPTVDMFPVVDVSDTTMAASGTTKRISINNILACSPSATLASATITGDLTVDTSTLYVSSSADKVGIGTTSLSNEKLTVAGNISANAWLGRSNISVPAGDCSIFRSADNTLGFGIASTTAMTLNSSGLGLGVTPVAEAKIQTRGTGANVYAVFANGDALALGKSSQMWLSNGSSFLGANNREYRIQNVATSSTATDMTFDYWNGTAVVERMRIDSAGNPIFQPSATPATLTTNGQLTVNATSNTNLRFSYRGSDGTTRVANITLA